VNKSQQKMMNWELGFQVSSDADSKCHYHDQNEKTFILSNFGLK